MIACSFPKEIRSIGIVIRHHVTMLSGFPYLLAEMNHPPSVPSSLRLLISSGDPSYILPDGNIAFLQRKEDQIMIYGKRAEVAEVESWLYPRMCSRRWFAG